MSPNDPIAHQLAPLYEQCLRPTRTRRIQQRWSSYPALAGLTLNDIADTLADPNHPQHNPVAADLLRAHHGHDQDATTVLLVAIRPAVRALSRSNKLTHLWAAVGKLVAAADPDAVIDQARPFMVTLIGQIRRDGGRFNQLHNKGYITPWDTEIGIEANLDSNPSSNPTEQAAIARICLTQISSHVRAGLHGADRWGADRWEELLDHSFPISSATPNGGARRNRVHRLRCELVVLTGGHAA